MMDLRAPFSNRITYGKDSTEGVVDVLETYCYLKGLAVQRQLRFDFDDQVYRVIRSGTRAVVFRNVSDDMEDTEALLEILNDARLVGVTQLIFIKILQISMFINVFQCFLVHSS